MPTSEEVFTVMKGLDGLDGFSSPCPDGFRGCFFTFCWEVVSHDVTLTIQSFFTDGYILPHFNSNLLILIPTTHDYSNVKV